MNTTQLQCFTTLANTLNYVRAAEELHMTQPAVSRQIQSLEQELNAKLFTRTTRSVSLTQIGAQFLPEAVSMLNTYYHSLEWIGSFHSDIFHKFRIGYADPHALRLIGESLEPLLESRGNISPEFTFDQTDANLRKLVSGDLDVVFGIKDALFKNEAIAFSALHEEHFYCICAKGHPIARVCAERHTPDVSSGDLFPWPQVINIPPYLMKNAFSRGHRIVPVNDKLNNVIVSNAPESYSLVLTGAWYSLLPGHLLMEHPDLEVLNWKESPHTQIGVYCAKDALGDRQSSVCQFIDYMKSCLAGNPKTCSG